MGRHREAFDASIELIKGEHRVSGFAPTALELASRAGCFDRWMEICRERGDALGFTAGLIARNRAK